MSFATAESMRNAKIKVADLVKRIPVLKKIMEIHQRNSRNINSDINWLVSQSVYSINENFDLGNKLLWT